MLEEGVRELPLSAHDLESILLERRAMCAARAEFLALVDECVDRGDEILDGLRLS